MFPLTEEDSTKDILEAEVDKIFGRLSSKALKISELLSAFALPPISELVKREYKNVWHTQYPPSAIVKSAVFKELMGIVSYHTLAKVLKRYPEEAKNLGFREGEIPGHRTFSRCTAGEIKDLAKWTAWKITEEANVKGIRLIDPRSVGGEKKLKMGNMKKICRLAEKKIFSLINISSEHHNLKYSVEDMLNLLLHAAMTNDFAENASKTLKELHPNRRIPDADTLFYHIKYHTKYGGEKKERSKEEIMQIFINAFDTIFKIAKKRNPKLFKGKKDVAIDFTDWLFYGDGDTEMVTGTKPTRGTHHAYKFGTICIVENGTRFTLFALPVESGGNREREMMKVIDKLLSYATKRIQINRVYMDRWFYRTEVVYILKKYGLHFIIQAVKTPKVKKIIEKNKKYGFPIIARHQLRRLKPPYLKKFVTIFVVESKRSEDGAVCFATDLDINEKNAKTHANLFKRRWGIETSYRVEGDFKPKTTSKNPAVRLFYFFFSVCMYNLWVIANMILSIVLGMISDKPLVTAKRLIVILQMSMAEKPPP